MKAIIRKDEDAVSPVIATILMVAITVVLAAVLYVMVSGLITTPNTTPTAWGVSLGSSGDGTNWTLQFTSIPQTQQTTNVFITVVTGSGAATGLTLTPLSTIEATTTTGYRGAYFTPAKANQVNAGDTLRLSNVVYPGTDTITILVGSTVVYQHAL